MRNLVKNHCRAASSAGRPTSAGSMSAIASLCSARCCAKSSEKGPLSGFSPRESGCFSLRLASGNWCSRWSVKTLTGSGSSLSREYRKKNDETAIVRVEVAREVPKLFNFREEAGTSL